MRVASLALLVALLIPSTAEARPGPHLRLEAATAVPLYIGPRLLAELPGRFRIASSLGWLPPFYVDGINELVMAFDGYDESTARLIEDSLDSSLVWRTHVGMRPFPDAGFYFEVGYGLVTLGGGTTEASLLGTVFGLRVPDLNARYRIENTLHMLDAEVGWEWWIVDRIALRTSLGVATTLDSNSTAKRQGGVPIPGLTEIFERRVERELDDIAETYVHTPVIAFAVGYAIY